MPMMRAVQVSAPGAEFELVSREIPEPAKNEVRVRVEACGVCHGDAMVKEGHAPGIQYPRVPGHEVVGIVDKPGTDVPYWKIGQRVGVGWYGGPCLKCEACARGDFTNCRNSLTTGISFDGGYAEYMVAPAQALCMIPDEFGPLEAAPLLCAGRTTFSALRASGAAGGDIVAIQGLGGLGHLALQFCRKMGFKTVALSRGTEKKELAYQLGAHVYIDADAANPAEELKKLGGARVILATAPSAKAISAVVDGLGMDGQLIVVAAPSEPLQLHVGQLFAGSRSIRGWTSRMPRNRSEDVLNFSVISGIQPMIEVFPLELAVQAYEKMMTSKVHFRAVLKISEQR